MTRVELEGTIAAAGFESGDRIVVGAWERGPLGAMTDVMWARPGGERVLLALDRDVARFVGGVYVFDETRVVPFDLVETAPDRVAVRAGPLELVLIGGRPRALFRARPRRLARSPAWVRVEDSLFRPLVGTLLLRGARGVRAYGTTASGVREWYRIDAYRPVVAGWALYEGRDLGRLRPLDPPGRFGVSEFPQRPALVRCSPLLQGAERFLPRARSS